MRRRRTYCKSITNVQWTIENTIENNGSLNCCGRVDGDTLALEQMIEVMLHVERVVVNHKGEGDGFAGSDKTAGVQFDSRNALNKTSQNGVVLMPEIHDRKPGHFLVPVNINPVILRINRPAILWFERRADEADMVVDRRIDQVPEFLFG